MSYNLSAGTNWKNVRLATHIFSKIGELDLQLPSRVVISERHDFDIIDGIEEYNRGVISKAPRYTFSLSIPSNVDSTRLMSDLMSQEEPFELELVQIQPEKLIGNTVTTTTKGDFRIFGEKLIDCYLNSEELTVETQQLPYKVYAGIALRKDKAIFNKTGTKIDWLSRLKTTVGILYGTGKLDDLALILGAMLDTYKDTYTDFTAA